MRGRHSDLKVPALAASMVTYRDVAVIVFGVDCSLSVDEAYRNVDLPR